MLNVYLFEKNKKTYEKKAEKLEVQKKIKEKRANSIEFLSKKYKKRISKVLVDIPEKLKAQLKSSKHRYESTKSFNTNYSTEKERIVLACSQNQWLDPVPTPKSKYLLRKRDRNKEISSDLRFNSENPLNKTKKQNKIELKTDKNFPTINSKQKITDRSKLYYKTIQDFINSK
jgi:hypothetical protein